MLHTVPFCLRVSHLFCMVWYRPVSTTVYTAGGAFYWDWKLYNRCYSIFSERNTITVGGRVPEPHFGHHITTRLYFRDVCVWEPIGVSQRRCGEGWEGRRDRTHSEYFIGARAHAWCEARVQGLRRAPASSPAAPPPSPPAFYYYWANITQALLIIHQHLSAKSHAEETRHPAAWREIKPSLRCIVRLVLYVQNEPWDLITNCLHEDGVFKKDVIFHTFAFV